VKASLTSKNTVLDKSTSNPTSTETVGRFWLPGAVILLGLMACALGLGSASNYDIWRNLAVGRWIAQHRDIPRQEIFTFTETGRPWTDYEWLAEVVFWGVYGAGSLGALTVFRAAIVWMTGLMLLAQFRQRLRAPAWAVVLAAAPALLLSEFHLLVRPHLWSLLLAPLLVWWIGRPRRGRTVGVVLIFALWANVHSGTLGVLVLGLALGGGLLRTDRVKTVVAALSGLLLNPYGWRIVLPLISILQAQSPDRLQVTEWMGLPLNRMPGFWVYLALSALLLIVRGRGLRRWDAVALLGFGILSLKAVRMVPYAALLAVPGNAEGMWLLVRRWRGLALSVVGGIAAIGAAAVVVTPRLPFSMTPDPRTYPEAAACYVEDHGLGIRCYNDMHHGAYLIWRWFPERTVYMDNRTELFADLASTERAACQDVTSFMAFIDGWGITGAVLDYPWKVEGTESSTYYPLFKFLGWQVVAWDDGGVLLLAPRAGNDSLIAAHAFRVLDPFLIDPAHGAFSPQDREVLLNEARRALATTPNSARAWQLWGNLASSADRPATALRSFEQVKLLNRKDPDISARMALALEKLGRYDDAAAEWKRQASHGLDLPLIWFNLGRLALVNAQPEEATTWLAKAVRAQPEQKSWRDLLTFAHTADREQLHLQQAARRSAAGERERDALERMSVGAWEAAQKLLREATALVPSVASFHQNLGACLANQGLWEDAEAELREALELDGTLGWARYNLAGLLATARADTQTAILELDALRALRPDSTLALLAETYLRELSPP